MDQLSVATSGTPVLSLGIQLVDSIQEISRFLRSVSQAPRELSRLIALLDQLHCLLDGVNSVLQRLRLLGEDIDVSRTILVALQACDIQFQALSDIIRKARAIKGSNTRLSQTWSSLRLATKKKDIEDIEDALHRAMNILQTAMSLNVMQLR